MILEIVSPGLSLAGWFFWSAVYWFTGSAVTNYNQQDVGGQVCVCVGVSVVVGVGWVVVVAGKRHMYYHL